MASQRYPILCVVALVACGDDGSTAMPDAAPGGMVSLTVKRGATPVANTRVYFQNQDSSLVSMATTDAMGVATATMVEGGFVTAVNAFTDAGEDDTIKTFAGVKPGDQLELDDGGTSVDIDVNVRVPVDTTVGVAIYQVFTTCGGGQLGLTVPTAGQLTLRDCNGMADVVVVSYDDIGNPIRAFFKPDVAVTAGATITFTDAYQAMENATFTYTNVPAGRTPMILTRLVTARGTVYEAEGQAAAGAGGMVATVKRPMISGAKATNLSSFLSQTLPDEHFVADWGPAATAYSLDVATVLLLPNMSAATFDIPTHSLKWTSTGSEQGDVAVGGIRVQRAMKSWRWDVAALHAGAAITFPVLPADAVALNPVAGDMTSLNELSVAKVPGGYDAVRAGVFDSYGKILESPTGRLVVASLSP